MALKGKIVDIADLNEKQIVAMYQLMADHYNNVDRGSFESDLSEKDWAILLIDDISGKIKGFSTQMVFEHLYANETLLIFFSGDTIIHSHYWGSLALPVTLGSLMHSVVSGCPEKKMYWLLISKGYRTYRFLPAFFDSFFPRYDETTPAWEQGLIASLGKAKFADRYNPASGILESSEHSHSLKQEFAILTRAHRNNSHIRYFLKANPNFRQGDELVCIAPFHEHNLKPYLLRSLKQQTNSSFN